MQVGVGYSENPDTVKAGVQAAQNALRQGGRDRPCDLLLLFATARHDARILRDAVASVVGASVPIVGGGAVGAITNDQFGYAGDQIVLAVLWLDEIQCQVIAEGGLLDDEESTGERVGRTMSALDVGATSPTMLFYDSIDRSKGGMRLVMASPLLDGIEKGLGFLPPLVGAGLMGDYINTPCCQWTGNDVVQNNALALTFKGDLRIDSVIMHGCRPTTGYYTVTRVDKQTVLEINGEPALTFVDKLLGSSISPEEYAFFLIFGMNQGEHWGEFDEKSYVNRLCLAIDRERDGIVMFEPDMVEGTRFQIMHRSLNLDYIAPKVERLFSQLDGRRPVFAFYIDCAGRAAGYAGIDQEDAVMVQQVVADRVPLLGIYTGVEIASVIGRPRALDWTGVFCLFSVPE